MLVSNTTAADLSVPAVIGVASADRAVSQRVVAKGRVLHLVNGEHYSGAERVQDLLAMCLPASGYDVGFVCVQPGRFPHERQSQDAPLVMFPMRTKLDLRPAWRIARLVRSEGYRLLHAHTPRTVLLGRLAAALSGTPLVYHVHSPTRLDSTRGWQNWANAAVEHWSLQRARRLLCVSASLARHMQLAGFPSERICVVPNGVPRVADVPRRRAPVGEWTLGSVALFRPRKGTEVLIRAVGRLRDQNLPVRLRLVGPFETAEYESQVRRLARQLDLEGVIDWVGFTRDVIGELARMDLFILPSLFGEGLPMVVLEAMAAGVPVIATDVEGVPEAIRHGRDGLIARPDDPDDLARHIARLVRGEADWSSLRASALARHADRFSDSAMAAGVARVYDEVLGAAGR